MFLQFARVQARDLGGKTRLGLTRWLSRASEKVFYKW